MKRYLYILTLFSLIMFLFPEINLKSQDLKNKEDVKTNLPKLMGQNNIGKEFFFTIPPVFTDESGGTNNFVKIYVSSPVKTEVRVEVPAQGFTQLQMTIPNDIIEFNLSPDIAQPYLKSGYAKEVPERVWTGQGIHVVAKDPLVVYVVCRYTYTSDGFLAIPVNALGKEYIAASYPDMTNMFTSYTLPSLVGITAAYDNTNMRFTVGGNMRTMTAGGVKTGSTISFFMMKGDVVMVSSKGPEQDLTGSLIKSDKPVSVVSGNQCTNIPTNNQWCDYTVENDMPTNIWGKDYYVGQLPGRKFPPLIMVFAKEDNTKIYRDGRHILTIPKGGGGQINANFYELRITPPDQSKRSVVISGDKPINVVLYNPGVQEDGTPAPPSDPFVMSITPLAQYQNDITFMTPGYRGKGFALNWLNLVYETDSLGLMPDDVEFSEVKGGVVNWVKVKNKFASKDELFIYQSDPKRKFAVKTITLPSPSSVYKLRAKKPFAAYSYGYDSYDSYGYPTSAALADLEKPDTNAPWPKWELDCYGTVNIGGKEGGTVTDKPDDEAVRSNLSFMYLDPDSSYNYEFEHDEFIPGDAISTKWRARVINQKEDARAIIWFYDRAGNDTVITLEYKALKIGLEPDKLDFGLLALNQSKTMIAFLVNKSTSPVEIKNLKLKTNGQGFTITKGDISTPLGPLERRQIELTFTATANGRFQDSVGLEAECYDQFLVQLDANVGSPIITVDDYDYKAHLLSEAPVSHTFQIKNSGTTELVINGYTGPFTANGIYTSNLQTPAQLSTNPIRIKPNEFYQFNVNFKAKAVTTYPDSIVFQSNAGNNIDNIAKLNGEGINPELAVIGFDWQRRRIHRTSFPSGPFAADNGAIELKNAGTAEVTINGINVTLIKGDETAFSFDRSVFTGMKIASGETKTIPITFQPQTVGEHEIEVEFLNSAKIPTKATYKGYGTVPSIFTSDYNFSQMIEKDNSAKETRRIEVISKPVTEWPYADNATITSFAMINNSISDDGSTYSGEGFMFDKSKITINGAAVNFPITMQPGDTLVFDGYAVAPSRGVHNGSFEVMSDAQEQNVVSNWTVLGKFQDFSIVGDESNICLGSQDYVELTVTNLGDTTITIMDINFTEPSLRLFNTGDRTFTLPAGGSKKVILVYAPSGLMNNVNAQINVVTDMLDNNSATKTATFKLSAKDYSRNLSSKAEPSFVNIGQPVLYTISLDNGEDITQANLTTIDITVDFRRKFLSPDMSTLQLSGLYAADFEIPESSKQFNHIPGTENDYRIKFTIKTKDGSNGFINQAGELATIKFNTFLPYYSSNVTPSTSDSVALFKLDAVTNNACADLTEDDASTAISETCVGDLREVIIGSGNFSLMQVNPNPVTSAGAEIKFSLAFEGQTELKIYNSNSELVKTLVSEKLSAGEHTVRVPVEELGSGVYFYELNSGPYNKILSLVIKK